MYDWANSVYSLVITSSIFPAYYNAVTNNPATHDEVNFFGLKLTNTVLYTYSLSLSFLVVALLSPLLTGIADFSGRKKLFMQIFCFLGSFACMGLFFFDSSNVELGIILSILACIGYSGSIVFYNSYLPDLVTEDQMDQVSAKGFTMGYIGSVVQLLFNLSMILFPQVYFNIPEKAAELIAQTPSLTQDLALEQATGYYKSFASRLSFLCTGIWWFGFAQITFFALPKYSTRKEGERKDIFVNGFRELKKVFNHLMELPMLKTFLLSFFFYNTGVQTVMYVATIFGEKELGLETGQLISVVLLLQIIAIGGAYFFAWISKKQGNTKALIIAVSIWVVICVVAYFVYTGGQFYALATAVGFVMGGVQALSRSTYSKLLPETEDTASYFSFYDVTEKLSIVIGTFSYAAIEMLTGSMRNSIIALAGFFFIGMFFLLKLKSKSKPV